MKLMQNKRRLIVQSRVSGKAVKRIKAEAKQKIKAVARPPRGMIEARAILRAYPEIIRALIAHHVSCHRASISLAGRHLAYGKSTAQSTYH